MRQTQKLGDLVRIRTGKLDANASSLDGEYPFFTCSRDTLRISTYSYDTECVLVAGNGDLNVKYYKGKFDAYQRTYIVESLDEEVLNTRYLYWYLFKYVERLRELSIGGVIKYIKINNLTDPLIPLPSLEEQRKIVNTLDKACLLVEKRKEATNLLENFLDSKFAELFGDLRTNLKNWEKYSLKEITLKITDGTHQSPKFTESGIPFIFISNIVQNEINLNTKKYITEQTYRELTKSTPIEKFDILYTTVGSYGHPAIVKTDDKFCFQRHIAHIKPDKLKTNVYFLYGLLKTSYIKQQADEKARGVAQKTLNLGELSKFQVILPPMDMQNQYADIVAKVESIKQSMLKQSIELDNQFQSLLQNSFGGKL